MNKVGPDAQNQTFHRLTVKAVRQETDDAKSFVLEPEKGETSLFRYTPGQFLSFRVPFEARHINRSYSISSAPATDPDLRICVKRIENGKGSNWFNDHLSVGDQIEATQPSGRFVLRKSNTPLLLIAGGSGITPCISLLKQALVETARTVRLIYANRDVNSVIFQNELSTLEKQFSDRLDCVYRFDDRDGFLTPDHLSSLTTGQENADAYICGPAPLMDMAEDTLAGLFGDQTYIMTERFASPDDTQPPPQADGKAIHAAQIDHFLLTLDGIRHTIPYQAGQTLLQAALEAGVNVPVSCAEGHCGTCMGELKSGHVHMATTRALSKRNIARGYVLACQSRPSTLDPLWLNFDL